MKSRVLCLALVVVAAACEDGPTSPAVISGGGTSATPSIAGRWSGQANDSTRQITMTWQLTQQSRTVSGTITASTAVGAPIYTGGTIAGSLSATAMTFTITVSPGSVVDQPDCSATFTGTADDIRTDSMAGTYSGSDTCGGTFVGGRFLLLKQ